MVESTTLIQSQEDITNKINALKADPTQYTLELRKNIINNI